MNLKDSIRYTINMGDMILTTYVSDLADADLLVRPVPGMNHVAWQLGHLIASEHKMLADAGVAMPSLPAGFAEAHTKETAKSDDRAKFFTKQQYLDRLSEQRKGTLAALDRMSDEQLSRPTPEAMRAYAKTVGEAFNMIGVHTLMHVGQFVGVRRKCGKPVVI